MTKRQQTTKPPVTCAGLHQEKQAAVAEFDFRTHQGTQFKPTCRLPKTRCTVNTSRIGERHSFVSQLGGAPGEIFGQRASPEEGKGATATKLDVIACMGHMTIFAFYSPSGKFPQEAAQPLPTIAKNRGSVAGGEVLHPRGQ